MSRSCSAAISRSFKNLWAGSSRTARSHQPRTIDPELTRKALLHNYRAAHGDYSIAGSSRNGKSAFKRAVFLSSWNVYTVSFASKPHKKDREFNDSATFIKLYDETCKKNNLKLCRYMYLQN